MQASNLLLLLEGSCPENVLSDSDMDIWTTWADGICLWHKIPTNLTFVTNVIEQHYWAISKPYNIIRCNWCDNVKLIIFITNVEPKFSGVRRLCSVMINNIIINHNRAQSPDTWKLWLSICDKNNEFYIVTSIASRRRSEKKKVFVRMITWPTSGKQKIQAWEVLVSPEIYWLGTYTVDL